MPASLLIEIGSSADPLAEIEGGSMFRSSLCQSIFLVLWPINFKRHVPWSLSPDCSAGRSPDRFGSNF